MIFDLWLLYVAAIFFVILIPGPLSLFMMQNSISYGIIKSYPAFVGGSLASSLYLIISATGLGVLLSASEGVFSILKFIGALYLLYVGLSAIKDSMTKKDSVDGEDNSNFEYSTSKLFKKSFLLGASNPKDIIFFMAFIPQFISSNEGLERQIAVIVFTWVIVDLICKLLYGVLAKSIKPLLKSEKNMVVFNKLIGGLYALAGVAAMVAVFAI